MWVFVWIASIIVATAAAGVRGRNSIGWFFLSIVFGPLASIVVFCLPKNQDNIELEAVASGKSRKCPHCAEIVKREAAVCRFCGRDIVPMSPVIERTILDRASQSGTGMGG